MTLGHDKALLINHQHIYVWMVHQYSGYSEEEDPDDGRMRDEFMSVTFSGMFSRKFDTPIPGPANSRWRLLVVFNMEGDWSFHTVNKLLPLEDTGSSCHHFNLASILPYLKRS